MAKKKKQKLSGLTVTRDGDKFTAKLSYPSAATSGKSKVDKTSIKWSCNKHTHTVSGTRPSSSTWTPVKTWATTYVKCSVRLHNDKGWGPTVSKTFALNKPTAVKWDTPALDTDTGKVSCEGTWDEDSTTSKHWHKVTSWINRDLYRAGERVESGQVSKADTSYKASSGSVNTSRTPAYDETAIASLAKGDCLAYQWEGHRYGHAGELKGTSAWKYVGWACDPTITAINADETRNTVNVLFEYSTENRPTELFQLQYVHTTGTNPSLIAEDDWGDVDGATANGNDVGINCTWTALQPSEEGQHVFIRVKATNEMAAMYGASAATEAGMFYQSANKEPMSPDLITVAEFLPGEDGESMGIHLVWNDTTYNGTRVAFSDYANALQSNKDPDTFDVADDWDEGEWTGTIGGVSKTYGHNAWAYLRGLDEATRYHCWLRRISMDDDTQHSSWSSGYQFVTGATATGVTLTAPATVATGSALTLSWLVGGEVTQGSWTAYVDGNGVASGQDASSGCTIPAEAVPAQAFEAYVVVTCGEGVYVSNVVSVAVHDLPTVTIAGERVITAKGHALTLASGVGTTLDVRLTSCGCVVKTPGTTTEQYAGELVWAETLLVGEGGTVSATYPDDTLLVDGCEYLLTVTPTANGLTGEPTSPSWQTADGTTTPRHTVTWAHQALAPSQDATTITTDPEALTATIVPGKPEGYAEGDAWADTDTFEVWRTTPDGVTLIASGVKLGQAVTDRWAPFGPTDEPSYTIATVTADGDRDWDEFGYELAGKAVRFDWAGGNVAYLHNLSLEDSWEKDFESRGYLDGTRDGWWGATTTRSMSVSADVLKDGTAEELEALRQMAQHLGEVFVRTPQGLAFAANVEVSKVTTEATSALVATSFDVEEVRCQEHVCSEADITDVTA